MNTEPIEPNTTTELTVQDRAALALGSSETEQRLKELAAKNAAIVSIVNKAGREQAHGAAMELKTTRVAIEKTSKAARDDATKFSKALIAEEQRLVAIIQPEETRLIGLRDGWDYEQQRIKEEAERVERSRITAIHERIAKIRGFHSVALDCRTSERVDALLEKMVAMWLDFDYKDDFEEFGEEAQEAYNQTHQRISALVQQKKDEELERARIKAEREAQAAEAKKLASERAALEAERADIAKERAAIAAKLETERLQKEAAEQADQAAKELSEYQAAITQPVEVVQVVEVPLVEVPAEMFADPLLSSGQIKSIPMEPKPPSAGYLIVVIATHFKVSEELAAEWLDSADFTAYY